MDIIMIVAMGLNIASIALAAIAAFILICVFIGAFDTFERVGVVLIDLGVVALAVLTHVGSVNLA